MFHIVNGLNVEGLHCAEEHRAAQVADELMAESVDADNLSTAELSALGLPMPDAEPGSAEALAAIDIDSSAAPPSTGHHGDGATPAQPAASASGTTEADGGASMADAPAAGAAAGPSISTLPEGATTAARQAAPSSGGSGATQTTAPPQSSVHAAEPGQHVDAAAALQAGGSEEASAALLDSIVGGELGKLDPVFLDSVPAQVCYWLRGRATERARPCLCLSCPEERRHVHRMPRCCLHLEAHDRRTTFQPRQDVSSSTLNHQAGVVRTCRTQVHMIRAHPFCVWQGVRLAAGELTLRVTEERRRRAVMLRDVGPLPEARMRGETGALIFGMCSAAVPVCHA